MKSLVIALTFGKDHIGAFQKFPGMAADAIKPGTAHIAAIAKYWHDIGKAAQFGVFHCGIVSSWKSADKGCDTDIGKTFFQDLDGKLVQDDLPAVIGDIDNIVGPFHILAKKGVFLLVQGIFVFAFDKRKGGFLGDIRKGCKIDIIAGSGVDESCF